MQSVGDQVTQLVASLERDHLTTLMKVDELSASNDSLKHQSDALASANAVLEKQLADRTSALAGTEKRMDEALAQVEVVANAALNMLRTVRGQRASLEAVQSSATPKAFTAKDVKMLDLAPVDATQQDTAAIVDDTDHIDWDVLAEERLGQRPPAPYDVQVVGDIMAADDKIVGDSGDEMVDVTPIREALREKLAGIPQEVDKALAESGQTATEEQRANIIAATEHLISSREPIAPPLAPAIAPPVELDAVDRMRRSSADLLPAPSLSGSSGPVLVVRNEPLPIFLARDTVFGRNDPRL